MKRLPLRSVLLGAVLGAIALGFVAFAVYIDRVERHNRIDDIDAELIRAERNVPQAGAGDVGGPQQATPDPGGSLDTADPPVQLLVASDGTITATGGARNPFDQNTIDGLIAAADDTRTIDDPRYRVRTTTTPSGVVALTALPLDGFDAAVGRFRAALAAGGGVIIGLVAIVLWAVTGHLARPVTRMAATANLIAEGHLDTAVDPPSGSRETADLSLSLHLMLTRLRGALDDANESRDAMERFLADMAHEIRTPLTALKGYSDLYRNGMLEAPADVDRAMSRIGSESQRLSELADAMLQLASAGSDRPATEMLDVAEVAGEVAADLRAAYPDQRIELQSGSPGGHGVVGGRATVHQAILNLGSNACHHNPPPEPIVIAVESTGQSVVVRVVDHGAGIDPADAERIFRPFYRSETARSRNGQHGAGLGLALAKQITDRHGGNLTVAPTPGGGATFTLSLPRHWGPPGRG